MRLLSGRFAARTVSIALLIVADLFALWVWTARPPRIYSEALGLVGPLEESPFHRLRAWAVEENAPRTPSGCVSLFETEELVIAGMLMFVLFFLLILPALLWSARWKQLLSVSPVRLLRGLPVRFRVRTALVLIAVLGLYLGWEIEAWRTWRLRQIRLQGAWTAANAERSQRSSLRTKHDALAKLDADRSPAAALSLPEQGYYRSKEAIAAERAMMRDRLEREARDLSASIEAYAERRRKYEAAVANPWKAVAPDTPIPEPAREIFIGFGRGDYARNLADNDEVSRTYPDFVEAHESTAWIRASCPDARFRDGKLAVVSATRACQLTNWQDTNALMFLAAAYAEAGDFAEAVKWQRKVVAATANQSNAGFSRDRLALYMSGKPCRDE